MREHEFALAYAPIVHFDINEPIPLWGVGYSILRKTGQSPSFRRVIPVDAGAMCVIEYAYYWDYDIQHMYDLEHIWVTVGRGGEVVAAEASFHGKFFTLLVPELSGTLPPDGKHIHAFCQPGKHAFMPDGQLFRLMGNWRECCNECAGGGVLVGWPFMGLYAPTAAQDTLSAAYIRENLAFDPTLEFAPCEIGAQKYMPWADMFAQIPRRIADECKRLEDRAEDQHD